MEPSRKFVQLVMSSSWRHGFRVIGRCHNTACLANMQLINTQLERNFLINANLLCVATFTGSSSVDPLCFRLLNNFALYSRFFTHTLTHSSFQRLPASANVMCVTSCMFSCPILHWGQEHRAACMTSTARTSSRSRFNKTQLILLRLNTLCSVNQASLQWLKGILFKEILM